MVSYSACLFDLDGTLLLGRKAISGASELVSLLQEKGIPLAVITNNSAYSARDHALQLQRSGIPVYSKQVYTSARAAGEEMAKLYPDAAVYVLGTPSLAAELGRHGIQVVEELPDAVLVGFDQTLSYERLRKACYFLEHGATFLATHPDPTCPTEGQHLPDAGALLALLEATTGRRPERIFGKPDPGFLKRVAESMGVDPAGCLYVGDRLEVDIPFALNAGAMAALVLSGATSVGDPLLDSLPQGGVLVVKDLWELRGYLLG
ncbi:HAD-IIA family hydrolase [Thermus caldilimi]|uniref:HAD-IIA family hydrolase n=1 Tax=Thermus caldilimi TaxID=2483360 RepID=UPI0010766EB2|nr:HAD-IIA family hydrolase [Thermus caldilimi]